MNLGSAPAKYDPADQSRLRNALSAADAQSLKRGQDIELAGAAKLILQDTVTGARYAVTVASGLLTATAL